MASFKVELPTEIIKELENASEFIEQMAKEMTTEGAKIVERNIISNAPQELRNSNIMKCLKVSRAYENGRGAIGNKIAFYGYFTNHLGKETPAPLVANVFEYGKKGFQKKPFIRKSFDKTEIERAMKKIEDKYLPKE